MDYFDIIREADVSGINFFCCQKPRKLASSPGFGLFIVDNIVVLVQMRVSVIMNSATSESLSVQTKVNEVKSNQLKGTHEQR